MLGGLFPRAQGRGSYHSKDRREQPSASSKGQESPVFPKVSQGQQLKMEFREQDGICPAAICLFIPPPKFLLVALEANHGLFEIWIIYVNLLIM